MSDELKSNWPECHAIISPYENFNASLPDDLQWARQASSIILELSSGIVRCLCNGNTVIAVGFAVVLHARIETFGMCLTAISNEITHAVQRDELPHLKLPSRDKPFLNALHAIADTAGLIIEVVWDRSYRGIRPYTSEELYALPL